MAASVDPIHLFATEGDTDRPTCFTGEDSRTHFVWERIGFSTKTAAHKGTNDIDLVHWYFQHRRECSMCVVRDLLRSVELKTPVRIPVSYNSMGLSKTVMDSFHTPLSVRGCGWVRNKTSIPKLLENTFLHVCCTNVILPPPMDGFVLILEAFSWIKDRVENFPFNFKQIQCFHCSCFINCCNTSNEITNMADLFHRHRVLILCHR